MQECIAQAQGTFVKFHKEYIHTVIEEGKYNISDLPLVEVQGKGKKFKEFFRIVKNVSAEDLDRLRQAMNTNPNAIAHLPDCVRPGDALGDACSLQIVVDTANNTVLNFFHSTIALPWGVVKVFCGHEPMVLNYKIASNSDLVKCSFLVMRSHIQGEQWLTQSLGQKLTRASKSASEKDPASWDPTPEELREGIDYINSNAPLANGKNEQFLWALLNVRDKDSPIFTWPMHVVSKACQKRTLGNSQAEPEFFFPLLISDLNAAFVEKILPLIVPTMPTHGLILLGRAGIGKTPLAIVLALALARHFVASRGLTGAVVGWRRSKQIDGFRERPGELSVPVLLDDPILSSMSLEDIKSFLDVGETCLVDARYRATKFLRNQTRILLNNEWNPDKEPELPYWDQISWQQFLDMFHSSMNNAPMPHLMAILKRATVVIAGFKAVYVRLASEHQSERIRRFEDGGITEDWLVSKNKSFYSHYKDGRFVQYPGYEDALEAEANLIGELLASPEEKEYLRRGATYDSWARDYEDRESTPPRGSRRNPAVASSPLIRSPPSKMAKTQDDDPDEAEARSLHAEP